MTGRTKATITKNQNEAWSAHKRDQKQREELIIEQLKERQALQKGISALRKTHLRNRRIIAREINQTLKAQARDPYSYALTRQSELEQGAQRQRDEQDRQRNAKQISFDIGR